MYLMSKNRREPNLYDVTVTSVQKPVADNIVAYVKKTRGSPREVDIAPLCPQMSSEPIPANVDVIASESRRVTLSSNDKMSRRNRLFTPIRNLSLDAAIIKKWWLDTLTQWEDSQLGLFYLDNPIEMSIVYNKYSEYCVAHSQTPL